MKLPKWLEESNRWKHLVGIFLVSLLGTALMGIGCIAGMEVKDVHHSHGNAYKPISEWDWSAWDWLDCLAGGIGAVCAVAVHVAVMAAVVV